MVPPPLGVSLKKEWSVPTCWISYPVMLSCSSESVAMSLPTGTSPSVRLVFSSMEKMLVSRRVGLGLGRVLVAAVGGSFPVVV